MTDATRCDKKPLKSVATITKCENYYRLRSNTSNLIICGKLKIYAERERYMGSHKT